MRLFGEALEIPGASFLLPKRLLLAYIHCMARSPLSRAVGLSIALLAGLSASSLALAHGYAHHRLHEEAAHEAEHHRGGSHSASAALPLGVGLEVEQAHDSEDHGHPQLSHAVSMRVDLPLLIIPALPANFAAEIALVSSTSLLLTAAPARAGPPDAPPRQPRAPPLG